MIVLEVFLLSLGPGSAYALLAVGLVAIYRGSGAINFGQGAIAMLASYTFITARQTMHWNGGLAAPLAIVVAAAVGLLYYLLIMRRLQRYSWLVQTVGSLAILVIIETAVTLHFGSSVIFISSSLPTTPVDLGGGVEIGADRLIVLAVTLLIGGLVTWLYKKTRFGIATSAASENSVAFKLLGRSPTQVGALNWLLGGAIGGIAGVLLAPIDGVGTLTISELIVPALAAALIGQFRSFPITVAGGLAIGALEAEATRYVTWPGVSTSISLVAIMAILLVRGSSLPVRGVVGTRLPSLGSGRIRAPLVIVAVAITMSLVWGVLSAQWVGAVLISTIFGIMGLSLVAVSGYGGQANLAVLTFSGFSAFIAGWSTDHLHLPFELALVAGVLASLVVGCTFALPAIRTRNVILAVVTLTLGFVSQSVIFDVVNPISIPEQHLFGFIALDPAADPRIYTTLSIAMLLLIAIALANIRRSRVGRRLVAVRNNERAAAALGIAVAETKLYAFALCAVIAGIGGVLFAYQNDLIVLNTGFDIFTSINVLVLAVLGGLGFILGPIASSALFEPGGIGSQIGSYFSFQVQEWLTLVGAVSLVIVLLQNPDGLVAPYLALYRRITAKRAARRTAAASTSRRAVGAVRWSGWSKIAGLGASPRELPFHSAARPERLSVDQVSKRFAGIKALTAVSLSVEPGELVGLMGSNGAGKTTLIDIISGFEQADTGSLRLGDRVIDGWSPTRRARGGICRSFQSLELFEDLTVEENLRVAGEDRRRRDYVLDAIWPRSGELSALAQRAVEALGLAGELQRKPEALPFGRRRLVAIARALAGHPSVLLLDEPAAGLDDSERRELGGIVRNITRQFGIGVLLVEHDIGMMLDICDRIVVLDNGEVLVTGDAATVLNSAAVQEAFFGQAVTVGGAEDDVPGATAVARYEP